jgi:hypothetical protein
MLQSHGLRAASGGGDYIPPEPGEYDSSIGGYFAGHMVFNIPTLSGPGPDIVYQLWISPKSMEEGRLSSLSSVGPYSYSLMERNSQDWGFVNDSRGLDSDRYIDPYIYEVSNWYIPALFELQQAFRFLRPSNYRFPQEGTTSGSNPTYTWYRNFQAVPRWYPERGHSGSTDPLGNGYPPDPSLVDNPDFQFGGSQAFEVDGLYVTSTLIDQVSSPVKANQIGKAVMHMADGQIQAPYYVQDYFNTGTTTYDLNLGAFTYGNSVTYTTDPMLYTRYVKRRNINVSVEYLVDYYETYQPQRFSIYTTNKKGRFRSKWNYSIFTFSGWI